MDKVGCNFELALLICKVLYNNSLIYCQALLLSDAYTWFWSHFNWKSCHSFYSQCIIQNISWLSIEMMDYSTIQSFKTWQIANEEMIKSDPSEADLSSLHGVYSAIHYNNLVLRSWTHAFMFQHQRHTEHVLV